jgi:selenocysteine lyase/cysteine desulfurase
MLQAQCRIYTEIAAIARDMALKLLVDASQSAGNVKINIDKDGIDMLAFTGHKSLFGTTGTGGIYIMEDISVIPLKTGGTGYKSRELEYPREEPHIYEQAPRTIPVLHLWRQEWILSKKKL